MKYRKRLLIMFIAMIFFIALVIVIAVITTKTEEKYQNITKESNINLSEPIIKESIIEETIFTNIKPLYMEKFNSIMYINYTGRIYGRVDQHGNIEMNLTKSLYSNKAIFCHELLHSLFWGNNLSIEIEEELIRDLSRQLVCYN